MTNSDKVPLPLTPILGKPLGQYFASEMILSKTQLNDAEQASLAAMIKGIDLTGANQAPSRMA